MPGSMRSSTLSVQNIMIWEEEEKNRHKRTTNAKEQINEWKEPSGKNSQKLDGHIIIDNRWVRVKYLVGVCVYMRGSDGGSGNIRVYLESFSESNTTDLCDNIIRGYVVRVFECAYLLFFFLLLLLLIFRSFLSLLLWWWSLELDSILFNVYCYRFCFGCSFEQHSVQNIRFLACARLSAHTHTHTLKLKPSEHM